MKMRYLLLLVLGSGILFSCNNAEQETRIQELEEKVAGLEKRVESMSAVLSGRQLSPEANMPANAAEGQQAKGKAAMDFAEEEYDFGEMNEGDKVKHVFTFTNTGEEPLVISNARGSCGCTVPKWPKEPIAPGGEGEINVEFNSAGKSGPQQKTVTITANTVPENTVLTIKAKVNESE